MGMVSTRKEIPGVSPEKTEYLKSHEYRAVFDPVHFYATGKSCAACRIWQRLDDMEGTGECRLHDVFSFGGDTCEHVQNRMHNTN
jgi:hypothetical protein